MTEKNKTNKIKIIFDSFSLLSKKRKFQYFLILFSFLVTAILEIVGIGLIFALLTMIIKGGAIEIQNIELTSFLINFDISVLLLAIIILYLFKTILLSFLVWYQFKYVTLVENDISTTLFNVYLRLPLTYHLNTNSSNLIRNITVETGQYSGSAIMNSLIFFKNIFLFLSLIGVLIIISYKITFTATILFLFIGYLFQRIMSLKSYNWGKDRQILAGKRIKLLQEAFKGIKTIKIFGVENFFFNIFKRIQMRLNLIRLYQSFIKSVPRIWFEFLTVLSFVIIIYYFLKIDTDIKSLIPIFGTLGIIMIRLIPSITAMINNFQQFDFSSASLYKIKDDLNLLFEKKDELDLANFKFSKEIILNKVFFKYSAKEDFTLKDINLVIQKGKSIGIYGGSGVGKSTLLNLITGLISPSRGELFVDGKKILNNTYNLSQNISYVPQDIFMLDGNIINNISFGSDIEPANIKNLIKVVGLESLVDSMENKDLTMIGESGQRISGGENQRLSIARALAKDREILILDEPTKSLDKKNSDKIIDLINQIKKNKTIICVSHDISVFNDFDEVFELSNGSLKKNSI